MGIYSKYKYVNTVFGGDDGAVVPNGSTAQRASSPVVGTIRYNSDFGLIENFNSNGWASIDVPPIVQNISGTINENTTSKLEKVWYIDLYDLREASQEEVEE
jgi:hypothetical protein